MEYQLAVYSTDAVFLRMLELEFQMRGMSVLATTNTEGGHSADVVLLDLDSVRPPDASLYNRMIGFTRESVLASDDAHRSCSMIFHRPFEMRLLRREVLQERGEWISVDAKPSDKQIVLDLEHAVLICGSERISVSPKELLVMQCLLEHRGTAVARETLADLIGESSANKTDVYICLLRRKLESAIGDRLIKTDRKKGYRIP